MQGQLSLTIIEILVLMMGAIVLGITLHYVLASRMKMPSSKKNPREEQLHRDMESWKSRFFSETDLRDRELEKLKRELAEEKDNTEIYTIEAEEVRKENKELKRRIQELEAAPPPAPATAPVAAAASDAVLLEQLLQTQEGMTRQQEEFRRQLLEVASQRQQTELLQQQKEYAEQLELRVEELELQLSLRDDELKSASRHQKLSTEMNTMLSDAYGEFGLLREKIAQLEAQLVAEKKLYVNYEDLRESSLRLTRDLEELQQKYSGLQGEQHRIQRQLTETEKLLEQEQFENQRLLNRLQRYETLDRDLQEMTDSNQKLESQLKRIGELESMLNMLTEERLQRQSRG
jgi:hypothetical protein